MNPLYLIGILAGAYGIVHMAKSSAAAAKTAASGHGGAAAAHNFRFLGNQGGTPLQQLQNAIKDGETALAGWKAATTDAWLDDNHNALVPVLNRLMQFYTLLGSAGRTVTGYAIQHPEMKPYYGALQAKASLLHQMVYKGWATGRGGGLIHKAASGASGGSAKSAKDLLTKAQGIVNGFPSDGSDASAYVAWIATTASQVPGLVSDIQGLVASASNAQQDIAAAMAIIPQLIALVSKATASSASSSPSSGTDTPTTTPSYDAPPPDPSI